MRTIQIAFDVPDNILHTLNQNKDEFIQQTRLSIALNLFKNHKLTFGQAAELAGMKKRNFLVKLDDHNIDLIDYDASELEEELERFQ